MNSIPTGRKNRGFTLIELLVVIAIIAILAAILFPVFARARENARRASCQSNEKNIALGFKQYIQDNGEKYPPAMDGANNLKASGESGALSEYIKSGAIFICPSDSVKTGSYGYNNAQVAERNESAIPDSAGTVLLGETESTRHFDGQNLAYVDGHVKWSKGGSAYDGNTSSYDANGLYTGVTTGLLKYGTGSQPYIDQDTANWGTYQGIGTQCTSPKLANRCAVPATGTTHILHNASGGGSGQITVTVSGNGASGGGTWNYPGGNDYQKWPITLPAVGQTFDVTVVGQKTQKFYFKVS